MKIRITFTLLLTALVLSLTVITSADITTRIRFAKGKNSATVSGSVVRGDRENFLVGAKAGQTMTVRISSLEDNAVFQIEGPDGEYLPGVADGDDAMKFMGVLPNKGDYKIIVGGTRGNTTYKLTVSIK
jgi:hypothetical protein